MKISFPTFPEPLYSRNLPFRENLLSFSIFCNRAFNEEQSALKVLKFFIFSLEKEIHIIFFDSNGE